MLRGRIVHFFDKSVKLCMFVAPRVLKKSGYSGIAETSCNKNNSGVIKMLTSAFFIQNWFILVTRLFSDASIFVENLSIDNRGNVILLSKNAQFP